jgi:hypothetical protein
VGSASDLIHGWDASGTIGVIKPEVPTVTEALEKFFLDANRARSVEIDDWKAEERPREAAAAVGRNARLPATQESRCRCLAPIPRALARCADHRVQEP